MPAYIAYGIEPPGCPFAYYSGCLRASHGRCSCCCCIESLFPRWSVPGAGQKSTRRVAYAYHACMQVAMAELSPEHAATARRLARSLAASCMQLHAAAARYDVVLGITSNLAQPEERQRIKEISNRGHYHATLQTLAHRCVQCCTARFPEKKMFQNCQGCQKTTAPVISVSMWLSVGFGHFCTCVVHGSRPLFIAGVGYCLQCALLRSGWQSLLPYYIYFSSSICSCMQAAAVGACEANSTETVPHTHGAHACD